MTAVLVDLDGTLIDPAPGVVASCRWALASLGRDALPDDDLLWMIGPPIRASFAKLLGGPADVEAALSAYRDYFGSRGLTEASIYVGVPEVLAELQTAHAGALFVCTSKSAPFAIQTVEHFGLGRFFRGVYGAEPGGRFEDKGDLIAHILTAEELSAPDTCMVGDRLHDVVAARRHDMPAVGVTWGYGSATELRRAKATRICRSVPKLPAVIAEALAMIRRPQSPPSPFSPI